jgi:hypothetical protein
VSAAKPARTRTRTRTRQPKTAQPPRWAVRLYRYYSGRGIQDVIFLTGSLEEVLAAVPAHAEEARSASATVHREGSDEVVAAWVRPVSLGQYALEAYQEVYPEVDWATLPAAQREAWCAFAGTAAAGASIEDAHTCAYAMSLLASGVAVTPWHEIHMGDSRPRFAWNEAYDCARVGTPTTASLVTATGVSS